MKYLIIVLSVFLLAGCQKKKETFLAHKPTDSLHIVKGSTTSGSTEEILIGTILFPKEIKGCSCYFATNKTDFENEKYIYADDAGKTAYMMLDGKKLAMNLISSSDIDADELLTKEIENDDYKISIKCKKIKEKEALLFEGTLTIEKPNGTLFTTPIYGECGC